MTVELLTDVLSRSRSDTYGRQLVYTTLYHTQVILLQIRRSVRCHLQAPSRAPAVTFAQPARALQPVVERSGKRLWYLG